MRNRTFIIALVGLAVVLAFTETAQAQLFPRVRCRINGGYWVRPSAYSYDTGYGVVSNGGLGAYYSMPATAYYQDLASGMALAPAGTVPTIEPPAGVSLQQSNYRASARGGDRIRLRIRVPDENARIWIEDTFMTTRGTDRSFESPPLAPGVYRYTIRASWMESGKHRAEVRTITAQTGDDLVLTLAEPNGTTRSVDSEKPNALPPNDEVAHEGKVVAASNGKLTMTDMAGNNSHSHAVSQDAKIQRNGNPATLEELKKGDIVTVTCKKDEAQTVVRIDAKSASPKQRD